MEKCQACDGVLDQGHPSPIDGETVVCDSCYTEEVYFLEDSGQS